MDLLYVIYMMVALKFVYRSKKCKFKTLIIMENGNKDLAIQSMYYISKR